MSGDKGWKRNGFPDLWTVDVHGNAWGPLGVRVYITWNGELNVKQAAPNCGEPVPWVVVTYLREEYVKWMQQGAGVKGRG